MQKKGMIKKYVWISPYFFTRYCIVFCRLSLPVDGAELPTAVSKNVPYLPLDIPIKYKVYI